MTQSKRHSPRACDWREREGTAAHACTARAALQTTSRQGFRPEASQTQFNNYTCIQKRAVPCTECIRCSQNSTNRFEPAPGSPGGLQKQRNATIPHTHTPNKALNMTQSKQHSPCACHQRKGTAAHACTARAALQTTSRHDFRPEAS